MQVVLNYVSDCNIPFCVCNPIVVLTCCSASGHFTIVERTWKK